MSTCWSEGAHGGGFCPWAIAGENAVFPRPFTSVSRWTSVIGAPEPGFGCKEAEYGFGCADLLVMRIEV